MRIMLRRSLPSILSLLVATSIGAAGFDLALNTTIETRPVVASNGTGFLAVWVERSPAGEHSVLARRFTRGTGPTDVAAIRLGSSGAYNTTMAVAFGGGTYFVVWNDADNVLGVMVTPLGAATPPFVVASHGSNPAVAWNGSEFFVVWVGTRSISAGSTRRIFGVPVSAAGVLHGTARPVSPEPLSTPDIPGDSQVFINPQIAWTGQQYVVVWRGDFLIINCTATCMPPPPSFADIVRLS